MEENARGIPKAPFIEKVEDFVAPGEVEATLRKFQEMIAKYKTMEAHLTQRKGGLETKLPELKKARDAVNFLIKRKESEEPLSSDFEVNETLWLRAHVPPTDTVFIWLGANVMLEYTTDEAKKLLTEKIATASSSIRKMDEDLEYLREQITTMEVYRTVETL
ncbi:hypothetical protein HDU96_002099 [Phlyctochytrium bullatum]|nr:hypothetical protein HDU96_002099 [Phlyctochytrium bullatum]